MKVIMQIVCGKDEFDRGEQIIWDLWRGARDNDIIKADICIADSEVTNDAEK